MKDLLFSKVISIFIRLLLIIDKHGRVISHYIAKTISENSDNYCHFKLRPHKSDAFRKSKIKSAISCHQLAIVIQGLPELRDNFTLESIRLYKIIFPGSHIIISTWDSVDETILKRFGEEGCSLVINKSFPECGFGNVNYQICTTYNGLLKAKELGAEFAIKCRSDLRIYREFAFEYLKSLMELLPVEDNHLCTRGRIVTLSAGQGQLFYPNWLQDYFYFGYTDDLINLFSIPYDSRHISGSSGNYLKKKYHPCTAADMCNEEVPEVFITKRFLEKNIEVIDTVESWWEILRKYFIIINDDDINAFWNKYDQYSLNLRNCEYDGTYSFEDKKKNINFASFLAIKTRSIKYEDWMEDCRKELIIFK